jgi:DNA-binding transcriptional LysR family regulator
MHAARLARPAEPPRATPAHPAKSNPSTPGKSTLTSTPRPAPAAPPALPAHHLAHPDLLATLLAVVEEGGFTRAAHSLFLTQPAISAQIRQLEDEIGHTVLDRQARPLRLTPHGELLVDAARRLRATLHETAKQLQALEQGDRGHLRLAASDTMSRHWLAPHLAALLASHPEVLVDIRPAISPEVPEQILAGALDLGFLLPPQDPPAGLETTPLFKYAEVALVPATHPLAKRKQLEIGELFRERLILLEGRTRTRLLLQQEFRDAGALPQRILEVGNTSVQRAFVRHGLGIAILPDYAVEEADKGAVAVALHGLPQRTMAVCHLPKHRLSPTARNFLELILPE